MKAGTALVDAVTVEDRYRRELGDVAALADSIEKVGLLHPIVVTSDLRLIAGQRRLEAARKLGWREVPVRIADDLDSVTAMLVAERDENTCRKDMTASELYALGAALDRLAGPTEERLRAARVKAGKIRQGTYEPAAGSDDLAAGRTSEIVAPAVGLSETNWKRLKHIGERATTGDVDASAVMDRIDEGKVTISKGYKVLRESDSLKDERQRLPESERAEQIRELASTGHVAAQIAGELGIGEERIRDLAHRHDIVLPDAAIGKRRRIDSNRIVRETVTAAEGVAFGLDLVNYEELDRSQIEEWTSSLSNSIRALNRLNKQLKELVA